MLQKAVILLVLLVLSVSCKKNPGSIQDSQNFIIPAQADISKIDIRQVNYDSLYISNRDDLIISSKVIEHIYLGKKDQDRFSVTDTMNIEYTGSENAYKLQFELKKFVDLQTLFFDFTIRFVFYNDSFLDVDTGFVMNQFPYQSTEIYLLYEKLESRLLHFSVQDFVILDSLFILHPLGNYGMYQYNTEDDTFEELFHYGGGDHLGSDSNYIFVDLGHINIYKYDLNTATEEHIIFIPQDTSGNWEWIRGITAENGVLYVTTDIQSAVKIKTALYKFDYKGNFIEAIPYPIRTYSLTKSGNYLYGGNFRTIKIYDLASQTYLYQKPAPGPEVFAIKIIDDYLYYVDHERRFIERMLLDEFNNYPPLSNSMTHHQEIHPEFR